MDFTILSQVNYAAVAVCSLIFFFLGSMWFGAFFGSMWIAELAKHNVIITPPTKAELLTKMGLNFLKNTIIALSMACLVVLVGSKTVMSGLHLGLLVAFGFAASTMADVFIWEGRSVKLFLIDSGYQIVGIILSAVILSIWS
ncbi:MAG TPA: DUF1761 domain-containing protein [Candidatus Babeliales bacterium]|nr:DUF1761 domain-containing protein [Candidatus Babeliales bacterium]